MKKVECKRVMSARLTLAVLVAAAVQSTPAAAAEPETGSLTLTFTERSPLSDPKTIAERFKLPKPPTDDYKLADQHFLAYVPPNYDATKPAGLLVLVNYKPSGELPASIFPTLDQSNLIFVVAKEFPDAWWQRAGLAIDASHNLQQRYKIDPRRVYILGGGEAPGSDGQPPSTAQRLGLCFPDVFTGTISRGVLNYRKVVAANGGSYPILMARPDLRYFSMAKLRPVVFALHNDDDQWHRFADAYKADGFRHVMFAVVTSEQYHYPVYTTDWLPPLVKFLDDATKDLPLPSEKPATRPATRATTKPAVKR